MRLIGKQAEDQAAQYLERKGHKIYFRDYRFGRFEVDIVCEYKDQIIIVEVKALSSLGLKSPMNLYQRLNNEESLRSQIICYASISLVVNVDSILSLFFLIIKKSK